MDIKCIALDLDRTTLNEHARLSEGNRAALEYAISKGVHIVIASGRGFDSLPEDVLSVPGIEYAITSNGASVYHIPSGKRLCTGGLCGKSRPVRRRQRHSIYSEYPPPHPQLPGLSDGSLS